MLDLMVSPRGFGAVRNGCDRLGAVSIPVLRPGGNISAGVSRRNRGQRLGLERCVQLGTVLGCAGVSGSLLVGALGIAFAPLSFREHNAIDGDSTQSCQTQTVILSQHNRALQGLLPSLPDQFAGLCACERCRGRCRPSLLHRLAVQLLVQTFLPFFVYLGLKGTFLPLSGPSFGFLSAVMLGSSLSRRCWWHWARCSESQRGSIQEHIFRDTMGQQQLLESSVSAVTLILGRGSSVQLF